MSVTIQQSVGSVFIKRADDGQVRLSVSNFRDRASLDLQVNEVDQLIAALLAESRPADA